MLLTPTKADDLKVDFAALQTRQIAIFTQSSWEIRSTMAKSRNDFGENKGAKNCFKYGTKKLLLKGAASAVRSSVGVNYLTDCDTEFCFVRSRVSLMGMCKIK